MRNLVLFLLAVLLSNGCARHSKPGDAPSTGQTKPLKSKKSQTTPDASSLSKFSTATNANNVITLTDSPIGRIATVNPQLRFVVLDYSLTSVPAVGERVFVYRQGLKVGELRVSGPQYNNNIVADVLAGDVRSGDEVRKD